MKENNPLTHMRIAGAMIAGLLLVELAGFTLFGVSYSFYDMALSLVVAFSLALVYSLAVWPVFKKINLKKETGARVTSLVASLAITGLAMVLWLHVRYLRPAPPLWEGVTAIIFFFLLAGLGAMLWVYLSRGDPHLANIRFRALAPVTVIAVGSYSVVSQTADKVHYRIIAVFLIFVFFILAYYLLIRLMWRGRRKFLERWGAFIHVSVIIVAALAAASGGGLKYYKASRPATAPSDAPPVVLISIDTLRSDYLSSYNKDAAPTPAMDSLAKDGILFKHAVAPSSWTAPSVASFLSGLDPTACGAGNLIPGKPHNYTGPLPKAETVAEIFQKAGYKTAGVVHNYWLDRSRRFDQGFDHYEMIKGGRRDSGFMVYRASRLFKKAVLTDWDGDADQQTARAIEILEDRAPGPFFLWIHYLDPHQPYTLHEKYKPTVKPGPMTVYMAQEVMAVKIRAKMFGLREQDKEYLRQRYEGEVRFTDDQVGKLFNWLKKKGLYRKSLIILTADHGEEFWEHGSFAHAHSFHKEVVEVPLIIKLPENRQAGAKVEKWVALKRIAPTMPDAAGISAEIPSQSLLRELEENPPPADERFFLSEKVIYGLDKGAVFDEEGHKAILKADGSVSCYDLQKDPLEEDPYDLENCPWPEDAEGPVQLFESLRKKDLETFKKLGGEEADPGAIPQDNMKKLKALGYF